MGNLQGSVMANSITEEYLSNQMNLVYLESSKKLMFSGYNFDGSIVQIYILSPLTLAIVNSYTLGINDYFVQIYNSNFLVGFADTSIYHIVTKLDSNYNFIDLSVQ